MFSNMLFSKYSQIFKQHVQYSSALPYIKYNCVVLLLGQLYKVFIYACKYFFVNQHCKTQSDFFDLEKGKFDSTFCRGVKIWREQVDADTDMTISCSEFQQIQILYFSFQHAKPTFPPYQIGFTFSIIDFPGW